MAMSKIEWTEASWNPLTGCTKISPGCKHCYAERMAKRLQAMGSPNYQNGFELTLHEDAVGIPLKWSSPRTVFVNSMSDLFHEDVPFEFIDKIFCTMRIARMHTFQILTKRSSRLSSLDSSIRWSSNMWMGVSVEDSNHVYRIDNLRSTKAVVKFLSMEPLLGRVRKINLDGIDWVIVGGESGPGARPMSEEWVLEIRDQCLEQSIPFFFKQWGGVNKKKAGRLLQGNTWNQMPSQVRSITKVSSF